MKKVLVILGVLTSLSTAVFADSVVGSVNGIPIYKTEAQSALKALGNDTMTFDTLPPEARKQLLEIIAPSKLVAEAAKKDLSTKEKNAALSGFWMQKKMNSTTVTDKEAKDIYEKIKKSSKEGDKVPPFEQVKENIKMQLKQEKVIEGLMKNIKIKVN